MWNLLDLLIAKQRHRHSTAEQTRRRKRLGIERLEVRSMMTGAPNDYSFADDFESQDTAAWQAHLNTADGFNVRGTGGYQEIGSGTAIQLVDADRGKALQVKYEKNEDRGQAVVYLPDGGTEFVRTRQSMRFGETFDFGFGQKAHRIWGMDAAGERATFDVLVVVWGKPAVGRADGDMTGVNDSLQISINYGGGPNDWGGDWADFSFQRGRWYDIVTELKLNDVGQSNGEARVWIDGTKVLEKTGILIRDEATDVANRVLFGGWYSNGAAGKNPAIDPASPSTLLIDDVSITTTRGDFAPVPSVSISDVLILEGTPTEPTRYAEFTVSVASSEAAFAPVTVNYATADGTAIAGSDYLAQSGSLTLTSETRSATIRVPIVADFENESDEWFAVRLSNPKNARFADGEAEGMILNDDFETPPSLSISDVRIVEGTGGERNAVFTVGLDSTSSLFADVSVRYTTIDGTAKSGTDYRHGSGTIVLTPDNRSATISVPVISDRIPEINESFRVRLSDAIHATVGDAEGVATIINDDASPAVNVLRVWRPENATWNTWNYATGATSTQRLGRSSDVPITGDFNGDFQADLAVWRPGTGQWLVQIAGVVQTRVLGRNGDIPLAADFNGDGRTEIAVYRPGDQTWWISDFATGRAILAGAAFGAVNDIPVTGDFNGDGRADLAVYRQTDGTWWAMEATRFGTWIVHAKTSTNNSNAQDIAAPGDYDGDGVTDLAVWNRASGFWKIRESRTNTLRRVQWGIPEDRPQANDYDGDGRTDIAVWRQSTGTWYVRPSGGGDRIEQLWGLAADWAAYDVTRYARRLIWRST